MNKVDFFEFENKSFEEVEERLSVRFLNISPLAELLENVPHRKVCARAWREGPCAASHLKMGKTGVF